MKAAKIFLLAGLTGVSAVNLCFAQTWTHTSAPSNIWNYVASSADGTTLIASSIPNATSPPRPVIKGGVWISWDSGSTWQDTSLPITKWDKVACSADGNILFAVSEYYPSYSASLCASTNSGLTWTSTEIPAYLGECGSLVCSADGSKVAALFRSTTNFLCTSSDFGAGLVVNSLTNGGANVVICSADGNRLVVVGTNTCISTNAGVSWVVTNSLPDNIEIRAVSASANAIRLIGAPPVSPPGASALFISTNGGFAWTETTAPLTNWTAVASSADGSKLAAIGYVVPPSGPGYISEPIHPIYTSTNSGATWKLNSVPAGLWWSSVASSADGTKLVAVGIYGGEIWTSQSKPTPSMQIMPTNNNLKLSWIVPSTNFVLQQSADFFSWTNLTNQPALNFTNLKEEVFLPFSGSGGFYRLKTP
jgi:hypothetical protein